MEVLIIFPVIPQTVINIIMLATGEQEVPRHDSTIYNVMSITINSIIYYSCNT